jgi:hypothetical protein
MIIRTRHSTSPLHSPSGKAAFPYLENILLMAIGDSQRAFLSSRDSRTGVAHGGRHACARMTVAQRCIISSLLGETFDLY